MSVTSQFFCFQILRPVYQDNPGTLGKTDGHCPRCSFIALQSFKSCGIGKILIFHTCGQGSLDYMFKKKYKRHMHIVYSEFLIILTILSFSQQDVQHAAGLWGSKSGRGCRGYRRWRRNLFVGCKRSRSFLQPLRLPAPLQQRQDVKTHLRRDRRAQPPAAECQLCQLPKLHHRSLSRPSWELWLCFRGA